MQGPTGAAALTDQLQRARSALRDGRPHDVLDELQTTLAALAGLTAATWSVLGSAYAQLGREGDRDDAYERAVEQLEHVPVPLQIAEVVDVTPALVATGAGERASDCCGRRLPRSPAILRSHAFWPTCWTWPAIPAPRTPRPLRPCCRV